MGLFKFRPKAGFYPIWVKPAKQTIRLANRRERPPGILQTGGILGTKRESAIPDPGKKPRTETGKCPSEKGRIPAGRPSITPYGPTDSHSPGHLCKPNRHRPNEKDIRRIRRTGNYDDSSFSSIGVPNTVTKPDAFQEKNRKVPAPPSIPLYNRVPFRHRTNPSRRGFRPSPGYRLFLGNFFSNPTGIFPGKGACSWGIWAFRGNTPQGGVHLD